MNKNILSGVTCEAKECKFNNEGKQCCAPAISVTGFSACCTPETACDTFCKR